jgi:hypothetical protein
MTFLQDEQSVSNNRPQELYQFIGSYTNYYYTSASQPLTYLSNTYIPAAIERTDIIPAVQDQKSDITIQIPATDPIVLAYGVPTPPEKLELTIHRYQEVSGEASVIFKGNVSSVTITSNIMAELTIPSIFTDALNKQFPGIYYQNQCNNVLYDARCGLNRNSFSVITTLTSIIGTKQVSVASVGAYSLGELKAGYIQCGQDNRLIVEQTGTTLTLNQGFHSSVIPGLPCTLYVGCDHRISTCRTKFNNVINFSGQNYIPTSSPDRGIV